MPPPTLIGTARDRPASVPNSGRPAPIPSLALQGTEVGALSAQLTCRAATGPGPTPRVLGGAPARPGALRPSTMPVT
eukprot:614549-Hanusia_phi.AAC.1